MKKSLVSALLALGGLTMAATPSLATTFGLFPHCGHCCGWCFPQVNAFTPPGAGLCCGGGCPSYGYPCGNCGQPGGNCGQPGGCAGPSFAPSCGDDGCGKHCHKHHCRKHHCRKHCCRKHCWHGEILSCPTCGGGESGEFASADGEMTDGVFPDSPAAFYGDDATSAPPMAPAVTQAPASYYPNYASAPATYGYRGDQYQGYGYPGYGYQPAYGYQNVSYNYQPSYYGYPNWGQGYQTPSYQGSYSYQPTGYQGSYGYQPAGYVQPVSYTQPAGYTQPTWNVPANYSYPYTPGWYSPGY